LELELEDAAHAHHVPVALLKAVAWVETRWKTPPLPGDDHEEGHAHSRESFGVMGLQGDGPLANLALASRLPGLGEERIALDRRSNIEGAAAILSHHTENELGQPLDAPLTLDAYHDAVARYGGGDDAALGESYAREVYGILSTGLA